MRQAYQQLSLQERLKIERWRHAKVSVNEMAHVLKRDKSTIFRELKRNHFLDECLPDIVGYFGMTAQTQTNNRRSKQRKLIRHPELRTSVIERVKTG